MISAPQALTRLLRCYDAEEPVAAEFRAQQLRAVLRLTPLTMLANVFNVVVVCLLLRNEPVAALTTVWGLLVLASAIVGLRPWLAMRQGRAPARASPRALRRAVRHATILALLWAALPIATMPGGSPEKQVVIAAISAGMICAGGFALATVPAAALAFVLVLTLGSAIGCLLDGPARHAGLLVLLGVYAFIVAASVIASARTFGARLMAEAEAERQKHLVGLLLHDFEAHASDWLWEIDRDGTFRHVSARLAASFGLPVEALRDRRLIDLLDQGAEHRDDDQRAAVDDLRHHLARAAPFRELAVPVTVDGATLWWALTAKPLVDPGGSLAGWRGVGSDITLRRRTELEMRRLANFDSLTGLANRHHFHSQLALLRTTDRGAPAGCALIYLDLDNFKNINDSLGHGAGDRVLQVVAQRLQARIRRGDVIARLGGDEFALISWSDNTLPGTTQLVQRLLDSFRSPCHVDGVALKIGSSIGIALAPLHGADPETLLKHADLALYAAKSAGRNTYRFFDPTMNERVQHRLGLLSDLRTAVEDEHADATGSGRERTAGQFELHYQPQLSLADGRVTGFEALMRWRHPERGLIPPSEFIPLAEESGLIGTLGAWALRQACSDAMDWDGEYRVAVNISAAQFTQGAIVDVVRDALIWSALAPERLEVEITESLLMDDEVGAAASLLSLRKLGVRVALDDFGTGYSSLAYLRNFPLDKLKIDRSFVSAIGTDASADAIIQAIVQVADALGLDTTAEGVETQAQADALRAIACADAQGFLYSPAVLAADVAAWLDRRTCEARAA